MTAMLRVLGFWVMLVLQVKSTCMLCALVPPALPVNSSSGVITRRLMLPSPFFKADLPLPQCRCW